eukprot:TRINITY_DN47747_c0_g1_i2.p1 TRINITY_DN47747_c0_g1~~TRINITY_DN47747_c0_g1_i2.p1  ORF type:complete len:585 (+),score=146.81 TRINITY_DN47747_c0_g1_i2:173-1756(+)
MTSDHAVLEKTLQSKHQRLAGSKNLPPGALLDVRVGSILVATKEISRYIPYGVSLSLVEIEKRAYNESNKKGKKPGIDITDAPDVIVEQEHLLHPELRELSLPRIFLALKGAIEDLGGLEMEGIFRISSEYSDIDRVYDKLRVNDYDVAFSDSILAANCLKKWLRELKDCLVPQQMCDAVVKAVSISSSDLTLGEELLKEIFSRLGKANQLIIKGLLRLMRDISFNDNVSSTRMSMPNLAVVFGPAFLRADEINDMQKAFKVAEAAQSLILMWVHLIDVQDYPSEQEKLAAFPKVVAVKPKDQWKRAPVSNYIPVTRVLKMMDEITPFGQAPNSEEQKTEVKIEDISTLESRNSALARKWSVEQMKVFQDTDDLKDFKSVGSGSGRLTTARMIVQLSPESSAFSRLTSTETDAPLKGANPSAELVDNRITEPIEEEEELTSAENRKTTSHRDSIARIARCWKCQAKAVNSEFCVNCWAPLDPAKAVMKQQLEATTSMVHRLNQKAGNSNSPRIDVQKTRWDSSRRIQ